jgi:hypothetical protein
VKFAERLSPSDSVRSYLSVKVYALSSMPPKQAPRQHCPPSMDNPGVTVPMLTAARGPISTARSPGQNLSDTRSAPASVRKQIALEKRAHPFGSSRRWRRLRCRQQCEHCVLQRRSLWSRRVTCTMTMRPGQARSLSLAGAALAVLRATMRRAVGPPWHQMQPCLGILVYPIRIVLSVNWFEKRQAAE